MKKILLIGYGNTLRADDGVGRYAVRSLAATLAPSEAAVLTCHQLMPELVTPIHRARRVVFVDASVADPPGTIRVRPLVPACALPAMPGHFLPPRNLLALVKLEQGRCPPAVLVSVGARSFDFGEPFSAEVRRSLPELMACLYRLIRASDGSLRRALQVAAQA